MFMEEFPPYIFTGYGASDSKAFLGVGYSITTGISIDCPPTDSRTLQRAHLPRQVPLSPLLPLHGRKLPRPCFLHPWPIETSASRGDEWQCRPGVHGPTMSASRH